MAWSDAARRAAALARKRKAKPKLVLGKHGRVSKASLALATYKPSTKEKQRLADEAEKRVSRMIGGQRTGDNLPVDTTVRTRKGLAGVEVKSVSDNRNSKITMHPESLRRKLDWGRSNRASIHTVVVDLRGKTPRFLYRSGVGSFRLHTLTPVKNASHLRELMGI